MTSCTDPLRLNEKRLFKELKKDLCSVANETKNILDIHDDVLYMWNAKKCCVFTMNVAAARSKTEEDVPYQVLQPTDPPIFEVNNVLINETATQMALWGNLGIVVIELPRRWGKDAVFQGGKESILCVSHSFGDFGATTEIRRLRWHPGSTNDNHLLVLTSENGFRLYECASGDAPKLLKCWNVGRTPSVSPSKIPNFVALGDTAVDFDFATPTLRKPETFAQKNVDEALKTIDWRDIEWPILVLRGNGEILIVRGDVIHENYKNPIVMGSLSMYPPADDNYGIDCCSIMCLQTTPPVVIIATCTGKIYHAILMRETLDDDDDKKSWSQYGSNYSLHTPEDALYVYECVEMELGLFFTDNDKKYTCPIHLHRDKGNKSRYFCSHNAGIHMVNLPIVFQLDEFINATNDNIEDAYLPSLAAPSSSQYLICTRTKHTAAKESTPILGFDLLQEPCILIALLHTGVVVDLSVIDLHYLPPIKNPEPMSSPTKKVTKEPFDVYIKNLLKHETSQPITKLGFRSKMSSRECLELLYRATRIFRTEHFVRHDKVREEFVKKVQALKAVKKHLLTEVDNLIQIRKELQQTAERLAEQYEEIKDKQVELARRAGEVVKLVNYKEPCMTATERAEAEELEKLRTKVQDLRIRLEQLKKKSTQQATHLENFENPGKKPQIVFSSNQETAIKENLGQMANDIQDLVSQTKKLEEELET